MDPSSQRRRKQLTQSADSSTSGTFPRSKKPRRTVHRQNSLLSNPINTDTIPKALLAVLSRDKDSYAPFHILSAQNADDTTDPIQYPYVEMPFGSGSWKLINESLNSLKDACDRNCQYAIEDMMKTTVSSYWRDCSELTNFKMLNRPKLRLDFLETVPIIVDYALMLPSLLPYPIPILKCDQNKTIYLTRKVCCSLLANAFFCTFPNREDNGLLADFNFYRLYNDTQTPRCEVKTEKLRCLLNYFRQFHELSADMQNNIISFQRRHIRGRSNWESSDNRICQVNLKARGKIEESDKSLQGDFANRVIGGGVMNDGSVMEEIRFCISPELLVSRLFTEEMNDDEVVVIKGTLIYSNHRGYSSSFEYTSPTNLPCNAILDNMGRTETTVVAFDALHFQKNQVDTQYQPKNVDRELHKCYVAFCNNYATDKSIATGNWGCGAFNGDKELKFLIQLLAASETNNDVMEYFTAGDQKQTHDIQNIMGLIGGKSVGEIYRHIMSFNPRSGNSVFGFIHSRSMAEKMPSSRHLSNTRQTGTGRNTSQIQNQFVSSAETSHKYVNKTQSIPSCPPGIPSSSRSYASRSSLHSSNSNSYVSHSSSHPSDPNSYASHSNSHYSHSIQQPSHSRSHPSETNPSSTGRGRKPSNKNSTYALTCSIL